MPGKKYKYPEPNAKQIFILVKVEKEVYYFKCGHRVMGSVFDDLIDIKTGLAGWQNKQLKLNLK